MQYKHKNLFWRCLVSALALTFFVSPLHLPLSSQSFLQLSFDAAPQVIEKNAFQEVRMTEQGNKIQRFFTGMKDLPFVDYLVIESKNMQSFIPIRQGMTLFTAEIPMIKEFIGLLKNSLPFSKNLFEQKVLWAMILVSYVFASIFFVKRSGFSLFSELSRLKIWLFYQHLRL